MCIYLDFLLTVYNFWGPLFRQLRNTLNEKYFFRSVLSKVDAYVTTLTYQT